MTTIPRGTVVDEKDERAVEEAHCTECNVPMAAIPAWYANVRVRFTCDSCRQKSSRLPPVAPVLETPLRATGEAAVEGEDEIAIDDLEGEDVDVELDEAEPEAEA